jgi:hypothetical protein
MKLYSIFMTLILVAGFTISCASPGFGPNGGIYTETKIGIFGTSPDGSKKGQACSTSVLGLFATGDGSISAATKRAGITKVNNINLEGYSILGVYSTLCTVVQGD